MSIEAAIAHPSADNQFMQQVAVTVTTTNTLGTDEYEALIKANEEMSLSIVQSIAGGAARGASGGIALISAMSAVSRIACANAPDIESQHEIINAAKEISQFTGSHIKNMHSMQSGTTFEELMAAMDNNHQRKPPLDSIACIDDAFKKLPPSAQHEAEPHYEKYIEESLGLFQEYQQAVAEIVAPELRNDSQSLNGNTTGVLSGLSQRAAVSR